MPPVRRPREVAVLIDSLSAGGAERMAVETAGALDPERYVPHLVATRSGGALASVAADRGIKVTILGRKHAIAPRELAQALAIVRGSDLVHAHLWGSGMWGALLARLARRPLLAHVQRFDADVSRGWLPGYRYWIAPSAHKLVCVSEEISTAFAQAGVPRRKLAVVPNGVLLGAALTRGDARAELGLSGDALVIGMVARLRPEKRHDLALRALAILRDRGHELTLCVVGDGREEATLRHLAEELALGSSVQWAGPVASAGRIVHAFDALLLSSEIEGMPLAVLEALVEGVPVVATPVDALPALLANGGGVLAANVSAEAIADAIASLRLPTVESDHSTADRARQRFGMESVTRQLERLYDEALGIGTVEIPVHPQPGI